MSLSVVETMLVGFLCPVIERSRNERGKINAGVKFIFSTFLSQFTR